MIMNDLEKYERSILNNFILNTGQLLTIPSQKKKKLIILEMLLREFDVNREYVEHDVNQILKEFHEDFCTLRRELIVNGFMTRNDKNVYRVSPENEWVDWKKL